MIKSSGRNGNFDANQEPAFPELGHAVLYLIK
jgi:hypothetical protein